MQLELWHGTNQPFENFSVDSLGLNTSNPASREAFFFAMSRNTAEDYAHQAARNLVPDQAKHEKKIADLLVKSNRALSAGNFSEHESLVIEMEEIEASVMQADPSGARVLRCAVSVSNPLELDAASHDAIYDLGKVLREARAGGHDGVILFDICDTPSGMGDPDTHVAVFSPEQIEILESIELGEPAPEDALEVTL